MSERDDVTLDSPSDGESFDTDRAREDASIEHRRHRRRLAAAIANFLAPGAGHMAIRRYRRGLLWMAATLALGALMIAWTHIATILLAFLATRVGSVIDGWRLPISEAALMPTRLPVPSWLLLMFGYVVIALVTRTYLLEAFKIPSAAMIPTLTGPEDCRYWDLAHDGSTMEQTCSSYRERIADRDYQTLHAPGRPDHDRHREMSPDLDYARVQGQRDFPTGRVPACDPATPGSGGLCRLRT